MSVPQRENLAVDPVELDAHLKHLSLQGPAETRHRKDPRFLQSLPLFYRCKIGLGKQKGGNAMRKSALLIILCLVVVLGLCPLPVVAQRGGGGHGGGFGGGFHGGGGFSGGGGHVAFGGAHYSGGYRGGAYYGGRGPYAGYRGGYPGYGYGWRGGYGYGWRGRYWGYPGWGWGYPYWGWGWGFGLGWGWPYWWGYPYGYTYGYPYSYPLNCPPGYSCPDNNGDDGPPPPDSYPGMPTDPANSNRPAPGRAPSSYAPGAPPDPQSNAPVVSVDHITASPASYRLSRSASAVSTSFSPKLQTAMQHLQNMPPEVREREIETGRYSHFSPAEKQVLRSAE